MGTLTETRPRTVLPSTTVTDREAASAGIRPTASPGARTLPPGTRPTSCSNVATSRPRMARCSRGSLASWVAWAEALSSRVA